MASSSGAASIGNGGKGASDTVTMQLADTTTTDENEEDREDGKGETVMRITTAGAEAIPYFLGAVVDHNPSSFAEEIEVETSASLVGGEGEEEKDVNMDKQQKEKSGEEGGEQQEQQQQDIVKHACDLAAVGEVEDKQVGTQEEHKKSEGDAVAEEPSQAEDEKEMTVTTTKELPNKCGNDGDIMESSDLTAKLVCGDGNGGGKDGGEGSIDKGDGSRMDVNEENGGDKKVDMKPAIRVSCIQWAPGAKRKQDEEEGREASPIPSTSTAAVLATIKTSSLPSSPLLLKDEWCGGSGNEDEELMDVQQNARMPEMSNTPPFPSGFMEENGGGGPTIQTSVGPSPGLASQSQLQGSVTTLLAALRNPMGNTVLPCCCCGHPCCIVMRELFSSCFPLWSNQIQNRQNNLCMQNNLPRWPTPPGFEDPPETEWITANVNHTDPSGSLQYKCRGCDGLVQYRSRRQKAYHLSLARLRFECKKCHRRYLTNKQLLMHSLRHNEKTRICSFCDKRFLTQIELQNHLNTHTKARPYRCPICFRRFSQTTRYYTHIKDFHKKYDCHDCYHSKVCAASSKKKSRALGQGSPKPSTSSSARLFH